MTAFLTASVVFWLVVFVVVAGAIVFLKRSGVLKRAKEDAVAQVKSDIDNIVK